VNCAGKKRNAKSEKTCPKRAKKKEPGDQGYGDHTNSVNGPASDNDDINTSRRSDGKERVQQKGQSSKKGASSDFRAERQEEKTLNGEGKKKQASQKGIRQESKTRAPGKGSKSPLVPKGGGGGVNLGGARKEKAKGKKVKREKRVQKVKPKE